MGDTIKLAHAVEKSGESMKIHLTLNTKKLLEKVGGFRCEHRGFTDFGVKKAVLEGRYVFWPVDRSSSSMSLAMFVPPLPGVLVRADGDLLVAGPGRF